MCSEKIDVNSTYVLLMEQSESLVLMLSGIVYGQICTRVRVLHEVKTIAAINMAQLKRLNEVKTIVAINMAQLK